MLNAPPALQMLSGACQSALAEFERTFPNSRVDWEHLEVLRSSGEGYRSVWEVGIWLPDRNIFCRCYHSPSVWESNIFFGNPAGVPGNHTHIFLFNKF